SQAHSPTDVSGVTVMQGVVMQSATVRSSGFSPLANARQTISRSVVTPIGRFVSLLSTTGISPQSWSIIIWATSCNVVSEIQQAGSAVITSFTFMALHLQDSK